jgi:hypothetical protein
MAIGNSSWWGRAISRRDARQSKPDIRPPGRSSKNTKKWCRGVVGRAHKPLCVDFATLKNETRVFGPLGNTKLYDGWKTLVCTECGKHLDHWWPSPFKWDKNKPKPDWVKED